jgi:hypothetical protein
VIATECYPDTYLLRVFNVGRKKIRHVGTKGDVVNYTRDNPGTLGIIDEDPDSSQPKELNSYQIIEKTGSLTLMEKGNSSRLIKISPRIEEWFYKRASLLRIDPLTYDLPRDANELHSIPHYEKKKGFQDFLSSLSEHDEEIATFKKNYLRKLCDSAVLLSRSMNSSMI